jgi:lipopolysaccharide transport system permease protein
MDDIEDRAFPQQVLVPGVPADLIAAGGGGALSELIADCIPEIPSDVELVGRAPSTGRGNLDGAVGVVTDPRPPDGHLAEDRLEGEGARPPEPEAGAGLAVPVVIWVILEPPMASLIFAFVFGVVAKLPSDGNKPYLLFAFAGMTAWGVFSGVLTKVNTSLVSNAGMLTKIYFPRLILPLASTASALVDSSFSLGLMGLMLVVYRLWPAWGIVLLPAWLAILAIMALGIGLLAASFMVRYRDIGHIIPVALQLGLYISPVAWSMTAAMGYVPGKYRWVPWLNPLASLLQAARWSLLGEGTLPLAALAYSIAMAAAVFWIGVAVFKQKERSFADVI